MSLIGSLLRGHVRGRRWLPVKRLGRSSYPLIILLTLMSASLAAPPEAGRAAGDQKSLDDALLEDLDSGLPRPKRSINKPAANSERPAGKKERAPATEEPAKRSLDDELLDGLEGEDVSLGKDPANENPLVRLNERMKQVERRIAETHSDEKTQRLQRDISDDLAKLITQLEQQCRQCKNPSPSSQRQQTSNSKPASKPGEQSGEKPASDSSPQTRDRETAKVDPARLEQMLKDVWGHLPAHLRQQMEQSANEEFLPKYETEISEYYRSLVSKRKERKK